MQAALYIRYVPHNGNFPSSFFRSNPPLGLKRVAVLLYDHVLGPALHFIVSQSSVDNRHGLSAGSS